MWSWYFQDTVSFFGQNRKKCQGENLRDLPQIFMILEGKSLLIMPPTHPFPDWYNLGQKWCAFLVKNDLQYEAIMKFTLAMIWGNILIFNCKHWSELGFLVKPWYVRTAWELELGRAPFSPLRVLSLLSSNNYTSSLTMLDIGGEWIGNFTVLHFLDVCAYLQEVHSRLVVA